MILGHRSLLDQLTLDTNHLGGRWPFFLPGHQFTEVYGHNPELQIPRTFGHQFSGLLDSYEGFLQPYLGDEMQHELDKLKRRVQEVVANEYDPALRSELEVEPERLSEILADMERVEGDVRAQATRISPTESRAN
jgi:hypothetical protein